MFLDRWREGRLAWYNGGEVCIAWISLGCIRRSGDSWNKAGGLADQHWRVRFIRVCLFHESSFTDRVYCISHLSCFFGAMLAVK